MLFRSVGREIYGNPTDHDVREYLQKNKLAIGCHCEKCKQFYTHPQSPELAERLPEVTLNKCPEGLFIFGNTLGFKSEYATMCKDGFAQVDAYCVESGEYFWGGTSDSKERAKLMVTPLLINAAALGGGK